MWKNKNYEFSEIILCKLTYIKYYNMTHMNFRPKNEISICHMNMTQIIYDINFKNPVYITFFLIRAFLQPGRNIQERSPY